MTQSQNQLPIRFKFQNWIFLLKSSKIKIKFLHELQQKHFSSPVNQNIQELVPSSLSSENTDLSLQNEEEEIEVEIVPDDSEEEIESISSLEVKQNKNEPLRRRIPIEDDIAPSVPHPLLRKRKRSLSPNSINKIQSSLGNQQSVNRAKPANLFIHKPPTQSLDKSNLSIGNVLSGKRPLTGQKAVIKVPPSIKFRPEFTHPIEELTSISPTISFQREQPPVISIYKPPEVVITAPQIQNESSSLKITSLRFQNLIKKDKDQKDCNYETLQIIETVTEKKLPDLHVNDSHFKKIIQKLRNDLSEVKLENENYVEQMNELKMKLSDALSKIQQCNIDILKIKGEAKRATLRFQSETSRVQILLSELSSKEEIIFQLNKTISNYKNLAGPAHSSMKRISQALSEENRLLEEETKHMNIYQNLLSSVDNQTHHYNPPLSEHMKILFENTQKSYLRLESKRKMWQEIERKQIMEVLEDLSLLQKDDPISYIPIENQSPFLSPKKRVRSPSPSENCIPKSKNEDDKKNIFIQGENYLLNESNQT